ncbi:MAG: cytochrome P450 [Pseudomonadota bacterium]
MSIPRVSQSPTDPAFVQNPYPFYARVLAEGGVVWWEDYNMPAFAKFSHISALLRDRRFGRANPTPLPSVPHLQPFTDFEALSLLEREPPDHTRLRGLVNRAFLSRHITSLAPKIDAIAMRLIDGFEGPSVDLIPTYCEPLPAMVIASFLGVGQEAVADLLRWSHAMVAMYQFNRDQGVEVRAATATTEFSGFLLDLIRQRRGAPADDLLSLLIAAEVDDARLSDEEIVATAILILNAGHEASSHAIGNGIRTILMTGAADKVRDPANSLADEILRHDPPLHLFTRYAQQDMSIHGLPLARGDKIALLLGAAGRDPGRHEEPGLFDPDRPDPAHLAFGAGVHFCVGAPLARLEIDIALRSLFSSLPQLQLDDTPTYADRYHFHGLEALRVRWD